MRRKKQEIDFGHEFQRKTYVYVSNLERGYSKTSGQKSIQQKLGWEERPRDYK